MLFEKKLGGVGVGVVIEVEIGVILKLLLNRFLRLFKFFCVVGGSCVCVGGVGGVEVELGNKDRFFDFGKKFFVGWFVVEVIKFIRI